jgi:hypothetical protein
VPTSAQQRQTADLQEVQDVGEDTLRELRQRAHDAGIRGNSKMDEQQLREALARVEQGQDPIEAKRDAHGWN